MDFSVGCQLVEPTTRLGCFRCTCVIPEEFAEGLRRIFISPQRGERLRYQERDCGSLSIRSRERFLRHVQRFGILLALVVRFRECPARFPRANRIQLQ